MIMKKNYILALFMLLGTYAQAQLVCPTSIKTNGTSTPANPIFEGVDCSASWPSTITVDGTLTYSFVSCGGGGKLNYSIDTGQTAPSSFAMTVDFGGGTVCPYDASGNLTTLSTETFKDFSVSITPNPATDLIKINLEPQNILKSVQLYSILGQQVVSSDNETTIDVSN